MAWKRLKNEIVDAKEVSITLKRTFFNTSIRVANPVPLTIFPLSAVLSRDTYFRHHISTLYTRVWTDIRWDNKYFKRWKKLFKTRKPYKYTVSISKFVFEKYFSSYIYIYIIYFIRRIFSKQVPPWWLNFCISLYEFS